MLSLRGLFAPLVTPFTDDGDAVSEVRLTRLVRHLAQQQVDGFACCTDTGEFTTISSAERKQVLEIVLREAQGLPVLAHCTRLGTLQALDLVRHAGRQGARAAIVMPPYFGQYADEEIEGHVRMIVQHAGIPVILVDPQHLVRAHTREKLKPLTSLTYAESTEAAFRNRFAVDPIGVASDEFVWGECVVSPLIQIEPAGVRGSSPRLEQIAKMIGRYGRVRVAKAALTLRGIETGPPRPPSLPLGEAALRELASILQTD